MITTSRRTNLLALAVAFSAGIHAALVPEHLEEMPRLGELFVAAAAIGGVMTPLMKKEGYDRDFAAAVNITAAPIGLLIPPSNIMVVYSLAGGGVSIAALFLAGYVPGIVLGLALMMVVAAHDHLTVSDLSLAAYARANEPKKLLVLPVGHFEAYVGESFRTSAPAQREWFAQHLGK